MPTAPTAARITREAHAARAAASFDKMAAAHEQWVVDCSRPEPTKSSRRISALGKLKQHLLQHSSKRRRSGEGDNAMDADIRTRRAARRQSHRPRRLPGAALQLVGRPARSATITLNRPERKNPLTFESYAELRDLFRALVLCDRRQGRRDHRRRRQLLLRRRRARDHRAARRKMRRCRSCSPSRA